MKQTFITKLLDNNGKMIDFERWGDKKIQTVERKARDFYTKCAFFFKEELKKTVCLAIYESPENTYQTEVKRIPIHEFLQQLD